MKTTDAKTMTREQLEAYCDALEEQAKAQIESYHVLAEKYFALRERMQEDDEDEGNTTDKEKELRRDLHILYHDFAESLIGWRRIAERIRRDEERAHEALRTGGNVEGRIHDMARWAGAIDRKAAEQAAALKLMKEIAEAATGEYLYLLDDIDD